MRNAMEPSLKALVSENIREHSDVNVKVAAASCVSEITRITAPDAPFEDEQMMDLAKELLDTFTARQMGKVFFTNSGSEVNDSQGLDGQDQVKNDGSECVVPVQQHNYQDLEMEYEASKVAFDSDSIHHRYLKPQSNTHDQEVFSFHRDHSPCDGFEEVLNCYKQIAQNVRLSALENSIVCIPTYRKRKEWDSYEPIVDLLSNEEVETLDAREERNAL
ncbi:hypothetical protein Syun_003423 [Stephania yunnanensis]|uniref:Copine C-terminal domain-containing protein n=1 Tax=Stephania yunnanensis TaxID=152371 RepID=A0AAP0Q3W0_9MAGN